MIKVLYLEDEPSLAKIVKESLQSRSFDILHLADGEHALETFVHFKPDVCLFDVMLPVKDGFTLGHEIRALNPTIPIIFITAKNQTSDVLVGFQSGGNDYIKKPFSLEELVVRINNLYNLSKSSDQEILIPGVYTIGQFSFYPAKLELHHPEEIKRLSYRETQLLLLLMEQKNQVVGRKMILNKLWGDDNFFNSRNLDVYISKLRHYFKNDAKVEIITLKAVGYTLIDS